MKIIYTHMQSVHRGESFKRKYNLDITSGVEKDLDFNRGILFLEKPKVCVREDGIEQGEIERVRYYLGD